MEDIKIVFVDIDGTLADDNNIISTENKNAIKKLEENGIIPVLCSGRTRNTVETRCNEIGISNALICSNGAEIFDVKSQKVIYSKCISKLIVKLIFNFCQKRDIPIMLRTTSITYVNSFWDALDDKYMIVTNATEFFDKKIVRIKCKVKDEKVLKPLLLILRFIGQIRITTKDYEDENVIIGIGKKNINKGLAIKRYLKKLKISKKHACAIGNELNDISMFKEVKYKVAMENSINKLKRKADFITLSNNKNGVSFFINETIFRGNRYECRNRNI